MGRCARASRRARRRILLRERQQGLRRGVAILLVLPALGAACGGETSRPAEQRGHQREVLERKLEFRVSGEVKASFSGTHTITFVTFESDIEVVKQVTLATISTRSPIPFRRNRGIIIGVSLVGNYEGDGDYLIRPRGNFGAQPAKGSPGPVTGNLSVVRVEVYDTKPKIPVGVERFDIEVPCKLHIEKNATVGSVRCPATAKDPKGNVTLKMSWGAPE